MDLGSPRPPERGPHPPQEIFDDRSECDHTLRSFAFTDKWPVPALGLQREAVDQLFTTEKVERIVQAIKDTQDEFISHFKEAEQKLLVKLEATSKQLSEAVEALVVANQDIAVLVNRVEDISTASSEASAAQRRAIRVIMNILVNVRPSTTHPLFPI